ncbi:hypothetical protein WH8501_30895 (plasmid) [Crocosphaera watsonii WH 8501]|uniref:hypothetical protein n=1 Tax=Crocosphaera watsonii TaxID=263511 RepID=UPI003D30241F
MGVILTEGDLRIEFTDALNGFVFDQMDSNLPNYHGIGQMSRVDFIVELKEELFFIEIKDPSNPNARKEAIEKFLKQLENDKLADDFTKKFLDSFIYRWAEKEVNKPINYIILFTLDQPLLDNLQDKIKQKLPPMGKNPPRWKRKFHKICLVVNIETWKGLFPKWPIRRISSELSDQ